MKKELDGPVLEYSYIPRLLPDELLYSFLGRLTAYNAHTNPREYLPNLFDAKGITPSVDLPTALSKLQKRLDWQSPFTSVDQMIDSSTLYPYHRPFLSLERHQKAYAVLLNGGAGGLKMFLGRVANRFGANPSLRYCPVCRDQDVLDHGAPYWHRAHQLPGVTSCADHPVHLVAFTNPTESTDRQRFQLVPAPIPLDPSPSPSTPAQLAFSRISREFLAMNLGVIGTTNWHWAYQISANRNNFTDANGGVRYEKLAAALCRHYKDFAAFQHRERITATQNHPFSWLRTIFERPETSSHPILHLILIGFFFGSVESFVRACDTRAHQHHGVHQDATAGTSLPEKPDAESSTVLQDRSLSCRAAAKILGISVNTVVSRRRALGVPISSRRKRLRGDLAARIHEALCSGAAIDAIAREFGISIATVYRARRENPGALAAHTRATREALRRMHRARLKDAIAKQGRATICQIRRDVPTSYAWLYRNDRDWLTSRLKALSKPRRNGPTRVDWDDRDRRFCEKVVLVHSQLTASDARSRISRTALIRPLGEATVRRNLKRLPNLRRMLGRIEETPEEFKRFRIRRAINGMRAAGTPVVLWRIQRQAGIKQWSDGLRRFAIKEISTMSTANLAPLDRLVAKRIPRQP